MRDPSRIPEMLALIERIWSKHPDLRFNQLIYNLQSQFADKNEGRGRIKEAKEDGFERVGFDLFSVEDEDFLEFLWTQVHSRAGQSEP